MLILVSPNKDVLSENAELIESVKKKKKSGLRLHKYILFEEGKTGTLAYNTFTKQVILLEQGEELTPDSESLLNWLWFVPKDFNDKAFADAFRDKLLSSRPTSVTPNGYTIVTTTGCNARCFYCYEKNIERNNMTKETASDVADLAIKNYLKQPEGKRRLVSFSWFGGEPLYNQEAIDTICEKLSREKIPFKSTMITNGYLFDEATVRKSIFLWNLKSVQITLDGTEEKYNKAKNYANDDKNPFKTVTDNIEKLLSKGINVSIRINVGYYNLNDTDKLIDFINKRYPRKTGLKVYVHSLFDKGGVTDIDTDEKREAVYEKMIEFENKLENIGVLPNKEVTNMLRATHCMADNGMHVTVQTDGGLSLCEHYVDSNKIGDIYSDKYDEETIKKFKEIAAPFENCAECPIYPECSKLVMCEDNEAKCDGAQQKFMLKKKGRSLKFLENKFNDFRNRHK